MKKLLFLLIICGFAMSGHTQNTFPSEKSKLFTDRAFFMSGEEIQFSGLIYMDSSEETLSQVVYVELVDPLGQKINQKKYYLNKGGFQGKILIPESLISGYYYLRAYTKYMRNGDPDRFARVMLKIVNPFLMDIQQLPDTLYLREKKSHAVTFLMEPPLKDQFSPGEEIQIDLEQLGISDYEKLNIAVTPDGTQYINANTTENTSAAYKRIKYFPETRGMSLSGTVLFNQKPSAYHMVYVNLMGEKDFISVYSDSSGRFIMALPNEYSFQELMIGAAYKEAGTTELLIDNDYESEIGSLKAHRFILSPEEESLALQLAKQYQINKWYFDSVAEQLEQQNKLPFYRNAFKVIDFDFYIPLDSMQLYFTDIPSFVQVKKKKGKRYFQLIGEESALAVYEPLIMVDWIPVDEADRILAMNPKNVKKVEVINRLFYHGNKQYGGIIHIITREGKMGDLKFPDANIYLGYQFPEKEVAGANLEFPVTRYWQVLNDTETPNIHFNTPEITGDYVIMIQLMEKQGDDQLISIPFKVRKD